MKAKLCAGVPTDTSTPRLMLRVDSVTLPTGTEIGGGAQLAALEKVNSEQQISPKIQAERQEAPRR